MLDKLYPVSIFALTSLTRINRVLQQSSGMTVATLQRPLCCGASETGTSSYVFFEYVEFNLHLRNLQISKFNTKDLPASRRRAHGKRACFWFVVFCCFSTAFFTLHVLTPVV